MIIIHRPLTATVNIVCISPRVIKWFSEILLSVVYLSKTLITAMTDVHIIVLDLKEKQAVFTTV